MIKQVNFMPCLPLDLPEDVTSTLTVSGAVKLSEKLRMAVQKDREIQ
jgi:hypothetical protein